MAKARLRMSTSLSPVSAPHVKKAKKKVQEAAYRKDLQALDQLEALRKRKK